MNKNYLALMFLFLSTHIFTQTRTNIFIEEHEKYTNLIQGTSIANWFLGAIILGSYIVKGQYKLKPIPRYIPPDPEEEIFARLQKERAAQQLQQLQQLADNNIDLYAELGLQHNASPEQIKNAFRNISVITHPDKNSNQKTHSSDEKDELAKAERTRLSKVWEPIQNAHEILSNPHLKTIYDQCWAQSNHPPSVLKKYDLPKKPVPTSTPAQSNAEEPD
jgi:DnaJ domain